MKNTIQYLAVILILFLVVSCDNSNPDNSAEIAEAKNQVQLTYAAIVFANYADAHVDAEILHDVIHEFIEDPTDTKFTAAKESWLQARESYSTTEAFRFADGPIDDENGPESAINAWPLDENFIDYVDGDANSGIINNAVSFPIIDAETLEAQNELGGEANISVGYHAIEFLLWGQDLTDPSALLPGQRPYTDYVVDGTASNQTRRGEYLLACADLLVEHLKYVKDAWDPAKTGNYRAEFLAMSSDQALTNILTGIGVLSTSELPGERIYTAYDNQDQEDEHSCFSDNTHRDIRLNALGIYNVYFGTYTRTNNNVIAGKSLSSLIKEVNPSLATTIDAQVNLVISTINSTETPFDFAISNEASRPKFLESVTALQLLGDQLVQGGQALGLTIDVE